MASTLSSDITASASVIVITAPQIVPRGFTFASE